MPNAHVLKHRSRPSLSSLTKGQDLHLKRKGQGLWDVSLRSLSGEVEIFPAVTATPISR